MTETKQDRNMQEDYPTTTQWWKTKARRLPYYNTMVEKKGKKTTLHLLHTHMYIRSRCRVVFLHHSTVVILELLLYLTYRWPVQICPIPTQEVLPYFLIYMFEKKLLKKKHC